MLHTKFRGNRSAGSQDDFLNVFLPYMRMVAILGHVTSIILIFISLFLKAYTQNLVKKVQWFLRKASLNFHNYVNDRGPRPRND